MFPPWPSFSEGESTFECSDCGGPITLLRYRTTKVPRCDDCTVIHETPEGWLEDLVEKINTWDFYRHHASE